MEITDEMVDAFGDAWETARHEAMVDGRPMKPGERRRAGLEAVFALIDRDRPTTAAVAPRVDPRFEKWKADLTAEIDQRWDEVGELSVLTNRILDDYSDAIDNKRADPVRAAAAATALAAVVTSENTLLTRVWALEDRLREMG